MTSEDEETHTKFICSVLAKSERKRQYAIYICANRKALF